MCDTRVPLFGSLLSLQVSIQAEENLDGDIETYRLAQIDLHEQKRKMKHDAKDYNGYAHDAVGPDGDES
jgi:hypothetical protein